MLIDSHFHAFSEKIAEKAITKLELTCKQKALTRGTLAEALSLFEEWGVDKGVLLPIATKPTQQTIINDWAAEHNQGKIIAFGSVHPDANDVYEELQRIKALGLYGVKLHPDYQDFFIDEPRLDGFFSMLEEIGLPVTIHAGFDPLSPKKIHCQPEPCRHMLGQHPKLRVILAHLGGNYQWQESLDHICGMDGEVYLDTAYCLETPNDLLLKMIRKHGSERVLFASDCPWTSSKATFEKLESIGLTEMEKDNIYYKNAANLFGLN